MSQSKQISYVMLINLYLLNLNIVCIMRNQLVWEITLKTTSKLKPNTSLMQVLNLFYGVNQRYRRNELTNVICGYWFNMLMGPTSIILC
jgi:hypothetical protein